MSKQKLLYLFITSLKHAAVTWLCMHLAGWYVVMHAAQTSLFNESWLMNVIYQSYLCKNRHVTKNKIALVDFDWTHDLYVQICRYTNALRC